MPYVFPYEQVFVVGVALLILVLLAVRVVLRKRQLAQEGSVDRFSEPADPADHHPMV